ncbi:hypothetical protein OIE13_32025 [Streptosporangium sp. NBC_01810]|uniref:hypothetical protein n=1 Tax=Streptosporangium sp. NBC_01810 TaxID=2975951 RepID=UPI002DDBA174|nr:hypothetical protein [Streptosporangium sp. NBC_01810]WSA25493.1 hypothetical protein OIE13_32025 [Streptosporangium sp. NBC_01810]
MTPPLPEESGFPSPPAEVGVGQAPAGSNSAGFRGGPGGPVGFRGGPGGPVAEHEV